MTDLVFRSPFVSADPASDYDQSSAAGSQIKAFSWQLTSEFAYVDYRMNKVKTSENEKQNVRCWHFKPHLIARGPKMGSRLNMFL